MKLAFFLATFFLFLGPISAQDLNELTPEQRTQLEQDLTSAQTAYESGDFESAKVALEKVYKQLPDPDVLYRLGLCYERLGQDRKAIDAYEKYLVARPLDPERARIEGVVRALKERSKSTTAIVTLVLKPDDSRIYVDGAERIEQKNEAGERRVELDQGTRTIRVSRDGFVDEERTIQLSPDQTYNLIVSLTPKVTSSTRSTVGWILAGSGVALIATGTALLGAAFGMNDVLDASFETRQSSSRPENFADLESRHNIFVISGWSAVGVGAGLTAFGGFLLLRKKNSEVAFFPSPQGGTVSVRF